MSIRVNPIGINNGVKMQGKKIKANLIIKWAFMEKLAKKYRLLNDLMKPENEIKTFKRAWDHYGITKAFWDDEAKAIMENAGLLCKFSRDSQNSHLIANLKNTFKESKIRRIIIGLNPQKEQAMIFLGDEKCIYRTRDLGYTIRDDACLGYVRRYGTTEIVRSGAYPHI